MDYRSFDNEISQAPIQSVDRAIALLWLSHVKYGIEGMSAKEVALIIESECGHPKQNVSRLHDRLAADRRTAKFGTYGFRLRPAAHRELNAQYGAVIELPSAPKFVGSGSIIPRDIFASCGREYLIRLVHQVNGCNDHGYFDGTMVLARKLLETLVIEAYTQAGRASDVKRGDGAFLAFEELVGRISADVRMHITRETKKALVEVKRFGDQSAHNPRFTARAGDVDALKAGIRIAAEELLNVCNFA